MRIDIGGGNKKKQENLMEVYVLDFDDNYHRLANEPSSELERAARSLKRQYKNLKKFNEALKVYNEWMEHLAIKHGGWQLLKRKIKDGVLEDYVPGKPKLRSKELRYYFEHGIMPRDSKQPIIKDFSKIERYINTVYGDDTVEDIVKIKEEKEVKNLLENHVSSYKYKSTMNASNIDILDEYFAMKNSNKKNKKKNKKKGKKRYRKVYEPSLSDYMSGDYLYDIEDTTDTDESEYVMYNGKYLSKDAAEELETYHKLNELGWNSYKLMKGQGFRTSIAEMFKEEKKRKKKEKKMKKKRKKSDNILVELMTDGGYDDFEEFQREMLSCTSANFL